MRRPKLTEHSAAWRRELPTYTAALVEASHLLPPAGPPPGCPPGGAMAPVDLADLREAPAPGTPPGPPRWKLAVLTFAGIYPLLLAVLPTFGALLADWPMPLRTAAVAGLLVTLMVFGVMPVLRRVFAEWLRSGEHGS